MKSRDGMRENRGISRRAQNINVSMRGEKYYSEAQQNRLEAGRAHLIALV